MDGITVTLEQLSTGAQEQMGLLVRLAAAQIVARGGAAHCESGYADDHSYLSAERYVHVGAQMVAG
jgi:hypothetical protein